MAIPGLSKPRPAATQSQVFIPTGPRGTSAVRGKPETGWIAGVLGNTSGILNIKPPVEEDPGTRVLATAVYDRLMSECRKGDAHPAQTPWPPLGFAVTAPRGFSTLPAGDEGGVSFIPVNVPGNFLRTCAAPRPAVNPMEVVTSLRQLGADDDSILKTLTEAGIANPEAHLLDE